MAKRIGVALGLVLGLVVMDQGIRFAGDRLVASRYWADNVYPLLDRVGPKPVVLVGDCRPLVIDTALLSRETGRDVVNLGRSSVGMGHMIFTLELLFERVKKSPRVFFFVNDEVLANHHQIRIDLQHGKLWWPMLPPDVQKQFARQFETPRENALSSSGLYRYRGRGPELIRATVRALRNRPFELKALDNPNFVFGDRSLAATMAEYSEPVDIDWQMDPASFEVLEPRLRRAKELGLDVTVVVSPMHRKKQTPESMRKVVAAAEKIAAVGGWPVLNYLTDERFLDNDEIWGNPGHLNHRGVAVFSEVFARDVK